MKRIITPVTALFYTEVRNVDFQHVSGQILQRIRAVAELGVQDHIILLLMGLEDRNPLQFQPEGCRFPEVAIPRPEVQEHIPAMQRVLLQVES